jgi:hypothetical protein
VIGLLRFVGLLNAAVWLGAAVGYTFAFSPATSSPAMQALLGPKNFPFFSVAVDQILSSRYFALYLVCGGIAGLHLLAEWLYFGRQPQKPWLWLVLALLAIGALESALLQPKLQHLHRLPLTRPELREPASRSFHTWQTASLALQLFGVAGLTIYFWRQANPPDPARFVSASKFRS